MGVNEDLKSLGELVPKLNESNREDLIKEISYVLEEFKGRYDNKYVSGISMDGLRTGMVRSFGDLHTQLSNLEEDYLYGDSNINDIKESMNELASSIGILCCVFNKRDDHFTDLSHINLPRFEDEDEDS